MEYEEAKELIVSSLQKKQKTKSKFYFNDLAKILDMKPRLAKKIVNQLVQDEVLEYWSRQAGWSRARRLILVCDGRPTHW